MELRKYFNIVRKWWWLVLLAVIIAGASSFYASKHVTPQYRAKTTLIVGKIIQNPDPNSSEIYLSQQLASTYQQMVSREPVLRATVETLEWNISWEQIASKVSATVVPNTQLIEISATDSNPITAKLLADTVAQQLINISPSNASQLSQDQLSFIQEQLADLKVKIDAAKTDLINLNKQLDVATGAREIQDIQDKINIQETKISNWQSTYADLLKTIEGGDSNALNVIEEASIPSVPYTPNTRMNVLLAVAIGLALSVGGIFLIEYLDDTIQGLDDTQSLFNLPTLAKIPQINGGKNQSKLIALDDPLIPEVDSFRRLRMNLQSISSWQSLRTIVLTSAEPSVGKSVTASNLAIVMAQFGQHVILVEADLRKPSIHKLYNISKENGLTDLLDNSQLTIMSCLKSTKIANLKILTCGTNQMSSVEVLGSERMKMIIDELVSCSDIVIIDCPPALVFSDTYLISKLVNGVIIVSRSGRTRTEMLKRVINDLRLAGINLLGIVIQQRKKSDGYGYGYGYGYYKYYSESEDGKKKAGFTLKKHKTKTQNPKQVYKEESAQ